MGSRGSFPANFGMGITIQPSIDLHERAPLRGLPNVRIMEIDSMNFWTDELSRGPRDPGGYMASPRTGWGTDVNEGARALPGIRKNVHTAKLSPPRSF